MASGSAPLKGIGTMTTWIGRDLGRQDQAFVVAMNHNQCTYCSGGHAPAGLPDHVVFFVFAYEFDVEDFCEMLSEVVAGSHL